MKIIACLQEKGGVGKTTVASHLAAGLAIRGQRVLAVDFDPQWNLTMSFGVSQQRQVFELLTNEGVWKDILTIPDKTRYASESVTGSLWLLAGSKETQAIPGLVEDHTLLQERLMELKDVIDVVVIDTNPAPSMLQTFVFTAADLVLCPTTTGLLSLAGLGKMIGRIQKAKSLRMGLEPTRLMGVQPMMTRKTDLDTDGLEILAKKFGDSLYDPIRQLVVWGEASRTQQTLFAYAPKHEATGEAWRMVERVEREMMEIQV